ncbi:MAG: septum formation protein Maf [Firmicutes bacterium]|nr:septum formation protein Maf [Bacillota bacterium]
MANLILASASPRRRELLHLITPSYDLASSSAEEQIHISKETPVRKVPLLLAAAKARDVAEKNPGKVVIGADTVVIDPEGEILGKPLDEADAAHMLRLLSGKTHQVVTGVCLYYQPPKPSLPEKSSPLSESFAEVTDVTFYPLSEEEIKDYVATGEPMDKAGAYGIQGAGSVLVEGIRGDFFNVVGLPVARLKRVLSRFIQSVEEYQS